VFDYESAKTEFGVGRAREMEKESRGSVTAATDAPQATTQPQGESSSKKAGVGGGNWNEDFDEAWGRRALENPKIKELFGLSDYSSLRDEDTRREINKWLRKNKEAESAATTAAATTQSSSSTTSATAPAAGAKPSTMGPPVSAGGNTTGKAKLTDLPAPRTYAGGGPLLQSGRIPPATVYGETILPGGTVPKKEGPWWPSYPAGGLPPAARPGTASVQATALAQQKG
jgi:hypothetical protein